jgi:hypothetical protein
MIFFSVGLPGRFAQWCDAVVSKLVQHDLGSVEVLSLNTLEELALAVIRTGASHFVLCCRQPGGGVQSALRQAGKRFIAVLDEPRIALRDLARQPGCDLVAATRAVASSCAAMLGYSFLPGALVLTPGNEARDPLSVACAIAQHLQLDVGEPDIQQIICGLTEQEIVSRPSEYDAWWNSLSERDQVLVNGALGAYETHFAGGDLGKITWERDLFFIFEDPPAQDAVAATRPVDITGRARCLIYGPFINLPPGSWSARVVLGFSPEAAGMTYVVEAFAGRQLNNIRIQPESQRILEVNLHFSIDAFVDQPIQIRVYNERAAFDGRLALGYMTLTPQASVRNDTRLYLTSTLGDQHKNSE